MTNDDLARQYEALRQAAAAVLDASAADTAPVYPPHQKKLDALARVLADQGPQADPVREIQDPGVHLLSTHDWDSGVTGGAPLTFGAEAESIRGSMALDDEADHPALDWPQEYPTLTELQAMTVATLLQELAARLNATGDPGGADLASVALALADEILAPTFAGPQRIRGLQ